MTSLPPPKPQSPPSLHGHERREHPRAETSARVLILSPTKAEAALLDISRSGMRLTFERPVKFQKGQELNVSFTLPGSELKVTLRLEVVRRASSQEIGLRFLRLSPEILTEIDLYVGRR